jgi:hypothetical protein
MQEHINMTAVEWLIDELSMGGYFPYGPPEKVVQQAKQMEKERMLEFGTKVAMKAHTGQSGWSIIEVYNENK